MSPNMEVLEPSRKKLRPGDIFVMRYPGHRHLFGRVILVDLPMAPASGSRGKLAPAAAHPCAPMPGANLIYVYAGVRTDPVPDMALLSPDNLLVGPAFINRLPWSRGYFQTIERRPLRPSDRLDTECFHDQLRHTYVDIYGNTLPAPIGKCGVWALDSFASLDDVISEALGIALAPDD